MAEPLQPTAGRFDLARLIDASPATISIIDPRQWQVIFQNRAGERLLGKVTGESCFGSIAKSDGPCTFCRAGEALATGMATSAEVQLPSGQWLLLQWAPVTNESGELHAVETITDITESKSREEEYRRLKDEYERLATVDMLTGLLNRRGWWATAERVARRLCGDGHPLQLLVLDIDRFKTINDRYGHGAGDEVLREVGTDLTNSMRPSDVVGRWGGEEFIVLVQPPSEQLMTVADRIRSSIAARTGLVAQAPGLPVTVSIGGYCVAAAAEPVKDLLEHAIMLADAQLYEAKRSGRNCTKLHAESSPLR